MALYNEILQGRFANLLTRVFAMVGGGPAPQLAPEIQPGFDLGVHGDEMDALAGTYWARCMVAAAGTGAQYPHVGLLNPAGSGAIAVIKRIDVTLIAALATVEFAIQRRPGTLAPAATGAANARNRHTDTRIDGTSIGSTPVISSREGTDVDPLGTNASPIWQTAGVTDPRSIQTIPCTIVLVPGAYIDLSSGSNLATTSIYANFEYYYRTLTPQEAQL